MWGGGERHTLVSMLECVRVRCCVYLSVNSVLPVHAPAHKCVSRQVCVHLCMCL